jgi:hypothetical protein
VYQLRVGSGEAGTPGAIRSNATPVSVAALVNPPAAGPVLTGSAPFTVTGVGFVPGATEVLAGTVTLAGVSVAESSLTFSPPPAPAGPVLPVRVRVNGVESDPAVWVTL